MTRRTCPTTHQARTGDGLPVGGPADEDRTFRRVWAVELDKAALIFARTRGHTPAIERAVAVYSRTGEHAACWFALGLAGVLAASEIKRRHASVRGISVVAACYGLTFGVKLAVRRRRPELSDLPPLTPVVSRSSFLSAHATTSFAAACAYASLAPSWALYGAATVFPLSRPYLGVHYSTDGAAGALLGTAIARLWPR